MTVIIAGVCGDKVVMVGDRLDMLEEERYEQRKPKICCLTERVCAGLAGTSGFENELFNNVKSGKVSEIYELLKERYRKLRAKLIKERLLSKFGVESIEELKSLLGDMPEVCSYYLEEIKDYDPDIKILIGGVDSEPHIFAIGNPGAGASFDNPGFYAIGTGEKEATMMLNFLNFRKDLTLKTCILYLYIAKKAAEIAVGVGEKTDIFVISKDGVKRVDEKDYYLMFKSWVRELDK